MRQELVPTDRVSGAIPDGGAVDNVCLDFSKGSSCIRAESVARSETVKEKALACARRAVRVTGCVDGGLLYTDARADPVIG